jgi:hypothetical protein
MRALSDLIHAHAGRPGMAMGGGVSLPANVAAAPANTVFASANQHGAFLRRCDYIICCDDFSVKRFKHPDGRMVHLRDLGTPIISPRRGVADFWMTKAPINNSGITAAWVLWAMGCAPILLAGMDCFLGGTYFYDARAKSTGTHLALPHHLHKWQKLKAMLPTAPLRSMGGPLETLFPAYDPVEVFAPPADRAQVGRAVRGIMVRVLKTWPIGRVPLVPGLMVEVSENELAIGLHKRFIERVAA